MASIGSLGRKRPALDLTFDYFGETIRVAPGASNLVEMEFMEKAKGIQITADGLDLDNLDTADEASTAKAVAAVAKMAELATDVVVGTLRKLIHPDDWATYWRLAQLNGQMLDDLMADQKAILAAVTEAAAGFPTGPSSGSSPSPASTPARFEVDLPSPATSTPSLPAAGPTSADRALNLLHGRPDLQEFVVMKEESERARNGAPMAPVG
ncbi:hypothetical protein [Micromonospora aurantiaca (nom. illeg.)]|uniref:hypothetical protein n=1 Tax=Micromonospora aurantiaca (nom. illeg.) TaxID=47850 RepID=UPI0034025817